MEDYIQLQTTLHNITPDVISVAKYINESKYANDEDGISMIAHEIFITAQIRPLAVTLLAKLLKELSAAMDNNKFNMLISYIIEQYTIYPVENANDRIPMYLVGKFLRFIYVERVINMPIVEEGISKIKNKLLANIVSDCFVPELGLLKEFRSAWPTSILAEEWTNDAIEAFNDYLANAGEDNGIIPYIRKDDPDTMIAAGSIGSHGFNFKRLLQSEEYFGSQPLMAIAAFYGSVKCFNRIAEVIPIVGDNVAEYAVHGGNMEIIKRCAEAGLFVDQHADIAIQNHRVEALDFILEKRPTVGNALAIECERSGFAYGLKRLADAPISGLEFALTNNHYFISSHVADAHKSEENVFTPKALSLAVENGMASVVTTIMKAEPKYIGRFPNKDSDLYTAILLHRYSVAKALLAFPVDVNRCAPAHILASRGDLDLLKQIVAHEGFDATAKDQNGVTLLNCAISSHSKQTVEFVLSLPNTNANAKDNLGLTGFHTAVVNEDIELAELMKAAGNDINEPDSTGRTPLHSAAAIGSYELTEYLLGLPGINVNALTKHRRTPLHDAIKKGELEVIKMIGRFNGVDLTIKDDEDRTPLHEAVLGGRLCSVEAVFSFPGVDPNAKCKGKTAFKMASTKEMRRLIKEHGGSK